MILIANQSFNKNKKRNQKIRDTSQQLKFANLILIPIQFRFLNKWTLVSKLALLIYSKVDSIITLRFSLVVSHWLNSQDRIAKMLILYAIKVLVLPTGLVVGMISDLVLMLFLPNSWIMLGRNWKTLIHWGKIWLTKSDGQKLTPVIKRHSI